VAAAAGAIAEALGEFQDGGLTSSTKMQGGELIAQLFRLRQFLIADFPDFDSIARTHGTAALRACDVAPATADALVDEVKVVRDQLN
jgi:hypothetical protein